MVYEDMDQFKGTGLSADEIKAVMTAGDKDTKLKMLRICRRRVLEEVHRKQQELDRLDFVISQTKTD